MESRNTAWLIIGIPLGTVQTPALQIKFHGAYPADKYADKPPWQKHLRYGECLMHLKETPKNIPKDKRRQKLHCPVSLNRQPKEERVLSAVLSA